MMCMITFVRSLDDKSATHFAFATRAITVAAHMRSLLCLLRVVCRKSGTTQDNRALALSGRVEADISKKSRDFQPTISNVCLRASNNSSFLFRSRLLAATLE